MKEMRTLESYFFPFGKNIIGHEQCFESPFGSKRIVYADWTASGRAYKPMEDFIQLQVLPFMANTHTGSTITGRTISRAYKRAGRIVKEHVHANENDILIFCGSGMTDSVNKLQRILGLRMPERLAEYTIAGNLQLEESLRPVVFLSHMEHHSIQVSWLETIATVELIEPDSDGLIDLAFFRDLVKKFKKRKNKILAITACSNVTGIETPFHEMAKIIHEYGGLCFVDFAASAPYVKMDMHPSEPGTHLDAIYFSPHKFLGGPGTAGVLIFNKNIYRNKVPDRPGGGTIIYSNPWKEHEYVLDIEQREDGGTPPIVQAIRVGMCLQLKEKMGVTNMLNRDTELLESAFERLSKIRDVHILAGHIKKRLGIISFIISKAPYNLVVKILNDRFGIQTRGGCSCAGTYGHELLGITRQQSYEIRKQLLSGNLSCKPGWIRLSIHPTMTDMELNFILDSIEMTANNFSQWSTDYTYETETNEYSIKPGNYNRLPEPEECFEANSWLG